MAPRREILDSEDEGDDFGSVNGEDTEAPEAQSALGLTSDHDHQPTEHDGLPPSDKTTGHSTGSTDPAFFQRVYEQQQAAVFAQDVTTSTSSGIITSPARQVPDHPAYNAKSSLNSVTDPVPASRKTTRKSSESNMKEGTNLTQLTTPRKGDVAQEVDPWELPMSPPPATRSMGSASRSSARITRSSEKRRQSDRRSSLQLVPEVVGDELATSRNILDPYEFPSTADISPVRPSKRKKRNPKSSLPQQVDPAEAGQEPVDLTWEFQQGQVPTNTNNGLDSSMPPTLPAMYIAPSVLTDSQKQQYRAVNFSSQNQPETLEPPAHNGIYQNNEPYKSSGATTIAYPTPSRFASSVQMGITDDMLPYAVPSRDPDGPVPPEPMSSPDELAGSARSTRTRSQATHGAKPLSSQQESPVATRSARLRTKHTNHGRNPSPGRSFDEPIILDNSQPADEVDQNEIPKKADSDPEARQSGNETQQNHTGEEWVETPAPAIPVEAPPKKKRGRKKKEQIIEEAVIEDPEEEIPTPVLDAPPDEVEEPPAKKRRGRPRKSETANTTQPKTQPKVVDDDDVGELDQVSANPSNGRGRKANKRSTKKMEVDDDDDFESKEEETDQPYNNSHVEDSRSLSDTSNNPRKPAADEAKPSKLGKTSDDDGHDIETKENINKQDQQKDSGVEEMEKPVLTKTPAASKVTAVTPTPGKVQYRVGLSRKSRIAPLLKSLKK